jgi:hypothetical protein
MCAAHLILLNVGYLTLQFGGVESEHVQYKTSPATVPALPSRGTIYYHNEDLTTDS